MTQLYFLNVVVNASLLLYVKERCPTKPDEEARGMEEIMAAEVASQNEAKRLNDSRLEDIEMYVFLTQRVK